MNTLRSWAEINLNHIEHNYNEITRLSGGKSAVMAVVKANAYGHGAVEVSKRLERIGCARLAVATAEEAAELREAGISLPVMSLGYLDPGDFDAVLQHDIIQTVYSLPFAEALSAYACRRGKKIKVHIKTDTGMSRLGLEPGENMDRAVKSILQICSLPGLETEGIFTHFATSEVPGDCFHNAQYELFDRLVAEVRRQGASIPLLHASNSGGILNIPHAHYDLVRPGLMLYGVYPGDGLENIAALRPAMALKARIAQIHDFNTPISVSYGRTYRTDKPIRTATVTIGYADGVHRALSNKMEVLVCGKRARQLGNVCMDMLIIDVTDIPVAEGDEVLLFGSDGSGGIPVEEVARLAGTIPYELLCAPGRRVRRVYI